MDDLINEFKYIKIPKNCLSQEGETPGQITLARSLSIKYERLLSE